MVYRGYITNSFKAYPSVTVRYQPGSATISVTHHRINGRIKLCTNEGEPFYPLSKDGFLLSNKGTLAAFVLMCS